MSEDVNEWPDTGSDTPVSGELVEGAPWRATLSGLRGDSPIEEALELVPAIGRLTAAAWFRSTVWGVEAGVKLGTRLVRVVVPAEAFELGEELGSALRSYAQELLGIREIDERVRELMPAEGASSSLRARGAELLRQSADVGDDDGAHPAYARILTELSPDEARILRLIARDGPQPTLDVRASNLIGVGSQLVAQGLSMMGTEAGCRHPERVPAYVNNLQRLGLISTSQESLDDPGRYQVLEAQPEAMEAIKRAGRARTDHRTVRLTAFGEDFCHVCLPFDEQVV